MDVSEHNKFIDEFNQLINNVEIKKNILLLLKQGETDKLFTTYFGINYNNTNIVSLKFYFSYFFENAFECLRNFIENKNITDTVSKYWYPSDNPQYIHRGLTLGLKCYFKNNNIYIRKYVHIRMPGIKHDLSFSNIVQEENLPSPFGLCFEENDTGYCKKKYAYFKNTHNILFLLKYFQCENITNIFAINGIEYTEYDKVQKINISNQNSNDLHNYLLQQKNPNILSFSKYFYNNYNLYFYSPGIRLNDNTKALYYVDKNLYYNLKTENNLKKIFKHVL